MRLLPTLKSSASILMLSASLAMADDRTDCSFSDKPSAYEACSRLIAGRQLRGQALADAYKTRGAILRSYRDNADGAIADFSEAIKTAPNFAQAYVERGFVYDNRKRDYNRAIADYSRAIQLDPRNSEALTRRASAYNSKSEYDLAIADYSAAIRLLPNDSTTYFYRGLIYYYNKNDHDRAIADYNEAIQISPRSALYIASRGQSYEKKGEIEKAVVDYREALAIDADNSWAKEGLERIGRAIAAPTDDSAATRAATPTAPSAAGTPTRFARAPVISPKALFEKHDLFGAFSGDCTKPPADRNHYVIHRLLNDTYVQADYMKEPTTRAFAAIFERGFEAGPNEIGLSGMLEGQSVEFVYRVEPNRMRILDATVGGRQEVAGGRDPGGSEVAWLHKCPTPGQPEAGAGTPPPAAQGGTVHALFEKTNLLGTFAWHCGKPVASDNVYYIHRPVGDGTVQIDQMSGPTTRDFVIIFYKGDEPHALTHTTILSLSGTREGQAMAVVYEVQQNRMRIAGLSADGQVEVRSGHTVSGVEIPWANRCPAPERRGELPPTDAQMSLASAQTASVPPPSAPIGSIKAQFEKYNLFGTFAWDCSKPVGPNNLYFVHRPLDGNRVQHDVMRGATTRATALVLDTVAELRPGEIAIKGTRDDGQTFDAVWRMGQNRILQWEASTAGKKEISARTYVATGRFVPWLLRCGEAVPPG